MKHSGLKIILAAVMATLLIPAAGQAQWWRHHPAYLKAMADLRGAYWLLQHHDPRDPTVKFEQTRAMNQTRLAYQDLKDAAIVDDRDIDAQPPADTNYYDHRGRLHHALDLLHEAYQRVDSEEDDPAARGLKRRALLHIDQAAHFTDDAIHAWNY